jgi:glycosyltransferase involved in cell wall biosynthesis
MGTGPSAKRIAMIGPAYPQRSGISHYNTLLFRELKKDYPAALFGFYRQYPRFLFPGKSDIDTESRFKIEADGIEAVLDGANPFTWKSAAERIAAFSPALVIVHWWSAYWAPFYLTLLPLLRRKTGARILLIVHQAADHEDTRLKRIAAKAVFSFGDYFLVHSDRSLRDIRRILPAASVKKALLPVIGEFNREALSDARARERVGVSGNVILFFGIVRKYKGLEILLEALAAALKQVPLTLMVVGEFWDSSKRYLSLADRLGIRDHVKFVDRFVPNEEVEPYFRAADAVVFPYREGAGSLVLKIAMSFAKPVIATRVGDFPEIVEEGITGFLADPGDARELSEKIVRFFKEEKKDFFSENQKKAAARYSWSGITDAIGRFLSSS